MKPGGKREGAGRKPGVPNKTTQEQRDAIAASGLTPLDYMLAVMRNTDADEGKRLDAAKAAAPYVHARLTSVELAGPDGGDIPTSLRVTLVGD
ncbi:MAG: hypothetical protein ABIR55_01995 [Burkholderiaceae bacterium]